MYHVTPFYSPIIPYMVVLSEMRFKPPLKTGRKRLTLEIDCGIKHFAILFRGFRQMKQFMVCVILVFSIGLSACSANQQEVMNLIKTEMEPETIAWQNAQKIEEEKCGQDEYQRMNQAGDKEGVIASRDCTLKIYDTQVRPFVRYNDLYNNLIEAMREGSKLYKSGDVSFDEMNQRDKAATSKYETDLFRQLRSEYGAMMQAAVNADEAQRERVRQGLGSMGSDLMKDGVIGEPPPKPRQVSCSAVGNSAHCTEW